MAPAPLRTVRLYLAALPEDMAGERALLLERVLPDLRRRAEGRGIAIELSDPGAAPERWGLEERLRAIEACDIFLAFLGERCGEPLTALPYEVLPVYSWLDPSWSLLEIEIRAAALDALPLIQNQGLFFVRIPEGRSGFPAVSPEEAERMAGLKEKVADLKGKVRGGRRPVVDDYPAVWSEAEGKATSLEDLEEALQRGLEWALENAVAATRSGADYQAMVPEPEPTPHLPSEPPLPLHEDVQFTVFKPRVVAPARWYKLLVFAHLQELPPDAQPDARHPLEEVQEQAMGLLGDQMGSYGEVQQESRHALPHEAEITFLLDIPGFDVERPRRTLLWLEAVQSETFRIRAHPYHPNSHTARGRLTVFWGSLILAEMRLVIQVDRRAAEVPAPPQEREAVRPFRKIFASYSHADAVIVEQCELWARTVGDEYLRDVRSIRAGEVWIDRLEELIREADLFQLFWSWKAMESPYVEREWRYALGLGRQHFVRPTYWEEPMPAAPERGLPPPELLALQFQPLSLGEAVGSHPPLAADPGILASPASGDQDSSLTIKRPRLSSPPPPPILGAPYVPSPPASIDREERSAPREPAPPASPAAVPAPAGKSSSGWSWRIWLAAALLLLPLLFRTCGSANRSNETPSAPEVRIGATSVHPPSTP